MSQMVEIPVNFLEEMAQFKFPALTQEKLDRLMDKNTEGLLSDDDREELRAVVELSERLSLLKGRAQPFLRKHGN